MSRRLTEGRRARLEELLADRGIWAGATDVELAAEVGVRPSDVRRVRQAGSVAEVLASVDALDLLREYTRIMCPVAHPDEARPSVAEMLRAALLEAVSAAYALRPDTPRPDAPKGASGAHKSTPGRVPGRRARAENGRGDSGGKGPESTATARRRVPSRPIGRRVDG